eukprot:5742409-Pleurochrysis_carterae.AAC.1
MRVQACAGVGVGVRVLASIVCVLLSVRGLAVSSSSSSSLSVSVSVSMSVSMFVCAAGGRAGVRAGVLARACAYLVSTPSSCSRLIVPHITCRAKASSRTPRGGACARIRPRVHRCCGRVRASPL